ncbi:MAG: YeeE/YedE family protein [Rhodocyclaceae bacterium]|nr:YeeE/YedE family protein [Azospira sp.]HNN09049.1 YeeE/YedE family protein [Azospira sp.]HNN47151.1 YeeE/YedE family protein [Azospira sp.]
MSTTSILFLAFGLGATFGALSQKTHFCTMGAVADIINMEDWSRMRMWLLAIAIAILGSAALHGAGVIDLGKSIYRTPTLTWLSHLVGGLLFGVGMVLASGCGARTLTRVGAGNLKSLVVFLVLGVTAYMTMRGVLGVLRVNTLDTIAINLPGGQDIPALLAAAGMAPNTALAVGALAIGGGLLAFCFARRDFITPDNILGGLAVGIIVIGGWYVSGHLGYLAEDPDTLQEAYLATNSGRMESLTFVAPQAYTLELLMLWSDSSRKLSFGIALALGVIAGSTLWALVTRQFRWEGFRDVADLVRHLAGGALMGFGGVTAMGCTIGQGITGVSTLALGSFITLLAIVAGAAATLKYEYWRLMRE